MNTFSDQLYLVLIGDVLGAALLFEVAPLWHITFEPGLSLPVGMRPELRKLSKQTKLSYYLSTHLLG